ncbi:MAG TPA: metal-binding protein [Chthonomonadaceae bacterium]|nr:metal-binding protein [Chthonomonadaceae bacterium]
MPDAPVHDAITLITAAAADVAYFHFAPHPDPAAAALFTTAYLFAGYACAGDLDLDSREYRRWGMLRFLWLPYRLCLPHRSWISHGLVLGGAIRAIYLSVVSTLVFWAALWGYSRLGPHVDPTLAASTGWRTILVWTEQNPVLAAAGLGGFILAGTAHSLADFIYSGAKRRLRIFR